MAMRADHRQDFPFADRVEHRGCVLAGIDDDDLIVVADDPRNCAAANAFDPRVTCCHRDLPSVLRSVAWQLGSTIVVRRLAGGHWRGAGGMSDELLVTAVRRYLRSDSETGQRTVIVAPP